MCLPSKDQYCCLIQMQKSRNSTLKTLKKKKMHPSLCQKILNLPLCDFYTADHYRKCDFPLCFTNRLATFRPRSCFLWMISCRIWERGEFRTYTLHFIHHCQLRYVYKTFVFVVFSLSWNQIFFFGQNRRRFHKAALYKFEDEREESMFCTSAFFPFFSFEGNLCKKKNVAIIVVVIKLMYVLVFVFFTIVLDLIFV